MDNPNINLDRVGGTKQSAADVVDNPNQALRVNVVAGGGGGGGPATIADGADIVEGTLADAAVTTDANGTVSGKLRGLVKILASVWDSVNGRLKVDGSAVTQPVSGTVAATQGTSPWVTSATLADFAPGQQLMAASLPVVVASDQLLQVNVASGGVGVVQATVPWDVSVSSSALPSGAATAAKQDTGNTSLASIDGKVVLPAALDGSGFLKTHEQGTAAVSAASLPLPSGASTSANQTTEITSLANLDVLLSTRTKPADQQHAIIDSGSVTAVVSGTVVATQPTGTNLHTVVDSGAITASQATGTNLHTVVDSGTITTVTGITNQVDTNLKQVGGSNVVAAAAGVQKVGVADGSGTAITSTAAALDINIKSGSIANTTFGATQGTAASLKAEVVGPTADNAINPTAKVTTLPAVANAAAPSNTEAHVTPISQDLKGNQRMRIQDAAGNDRGANVDGNNNLGVVLATETTKTIGTVAVNNAAGAAAVNIQDGGNSITVDGSVAVSGVTGDVAVVNSTTSGKTLIAVQGAIAAGTSDTANPVTIGANDSSGNVDTLDAVVSDGQTQLLVATPALERLLQALLHEQRIGNMLLLKLSEPYLSRGWPEVTDSDREVVQ